MKIRVIGIKLYAFHGVFEEERKKGTHFVVDIIAEMNTIPATDGLSHTINYQTMYLIALDVLREPVNLLETIAKNIGNRILKQEPLAEKVTVHVHKEKPLLMPFCSETSVELTLFQNS